MENILNSSLAVGLYHTFLDWQQQSQFPPQQPLLHHLLKNHSILLCLLVTLSVILLYWILVPINLFRDWSKAAQDDNPRSHPIPPVFPNGWVPIAESRDITSARIIKAKVHINQVIVVRKGDGKAAVYDAYCPHLGADLGVGGEVVTSGDQSHCIKCPFHGWTFSSSDGSCVEVPYTRDGKAPAGIRLKQWPTLERNGFVCVWHHAEGEEPHWFPPATAEIESGDWQYGGRTENIVNCHLQEIPENGADIGHLNQIHAPSMIWGKFFSSWTRTAIMNFLFGAHEWSAEWHADDVEQHLARIRIVQDFSLFGRTLISLDISVTQVGSSLVLLRFTCPQYNISGLFSQAVISVASNKQRVIHHVYLKQSIFGRLFSRLLLFGEANMVDRDCMMWQNKKFLKNPALVREEKSIARFRQWFQQFYSTHSPKNFASLYDW